LFGIIAIACFVIVTGGIELSVGAIVALLGVLFIDLIVNMNVHWASALIVVGAGMLMAGPRLWWPWSACILRGDACALLIYRGMARYYTEDATVGFCPARVSTLEWLTSGRSEVGASRAPFDTTGPPSRSCTR
jgi:ribose transport system permease protein